MPTQTTRGAASQRPYVLLVEDDADTRELMALALGGQGFDLEVAPSADHALEMMQGRRYDLVVTDYDMPGMTGAEMLREADRRGHLSTADALIVTAHPEPVGVEGLAMVRKPVDLERLVGCLRAKLTRKATGGAVPAVVETGARAGTRRRAFALWIRGLP